jgi:hypothetical protein
MIEHSLIGALFVAGATRTFLADAELHKAYPNRAARGPARQLKRRIAEYSRDPRSAWRGPGARRTRCMDQRRRDPAGADGGGDAWSRSPRVQAPFWGHEFGGPGRGGLLRESGRRTLMPGSSGE